MTFADPSASPAAPSPGLLVQSATAEQLRRRPRVVETRGFVAGLQADDPNPYLNYATPLPGAEPTAADVSALVEAFRARELTPRLEFVPAAAPAVAPALLAAGFTVEAEHDFLVCAPDTYTPTESGPRTEVPLGDVEFAALDAALSESFGGPGVASPEGIARLRRTCEAGGAVRYVRAADGSCAGGASCVAPAFGTAELSGVGTRPAHRRRGVAAAVVSALTADMFARGAASVWLEFSGDASRRVYERLGYRPLGTRLYLRLAPGDGPARAAGGED
ncbi:GNAT family N-acetyltransferase [Streptomyces sp. NPDC088923]|uniref:GNAT family N-acetyltransferase n=1 Tax=Streptomyces sp. NPDC088923 TaxID=3365913 RepID=UPI00381D6809